MIPTGESVQGTPVGMENMDTVAPVAPISILHRVTSKVFLDCYSVAVSIQAYSTT